MLRSIAPRSALALACAFVAASCAASHDHATLQASRALDELSREEAVIGLAADDLRAIMGPPALAREDEPAAYWRYGVNGCMLDFFLYVDAETGQTRVRHFEVRDPRPIYFASTGPCRPVEQRFPEHRHDHGL